MGNSPAEGLPLREQLKEQLKEQVKEQVKVIEQAIDDEDTRARNLERNRRRKLVKQREREAAKLLALTFAAKAQDEDGNENGDNTDGDATWEDKADAEGDATAGTTTTAQVQDQGELEANDENGVPINGPTPQDQVIPKEAENQVPANEPLPQVEVDLKDAEKAKRKEKHQRRKERRRIEKEEEIEMKRLQEEAKTRARKEQKTQEEERARREREKRAAEEEQWGREEQKRLQEEEEARALEAAALQRARQAPREEDWLKNARRTREAKKLRREATRQMKEARRAGGVEAARREEESGKMEPPRRAQKAAEAMPEEEAQQMKETQCCAYETEEARRIADNIRLEVEVQLGAQPSPKKAENEARHRQTADEATGRRQAFGAERNQNKRLEDEIRRRQAAEEAVDQVEDRLRETVIKLEEAEELLMGQVQRWEAAERALAFRNNMIERLVGEMFREKEQELQDRLDFEVRRCMAAVQEAAARVQVPVQTGPQHHRGNQGGGQLPRRPGNKSRQTRSPGTQECKQSQYLRLGSQMRATQEDASYYPTVTAHFAPHLAHDSMAMHTRPWGNVVEFNPAPGHTQRHAGHVSTQVTHAPPQAEYAPSLQQQIYLVPQEVLAWLSTGDEANRRAAEAHRLHDHEAREAALQFDPRYMAYIDQPVQVCAIEEVGADPIAETDVESTADTMPVDYESRLEAFVAREIREHGVWDPETRYNRCFQGHGYSRSH